MNILKLIISIIICQLAGLIGYIFTRPAIPTWYASLRKPFFTPPDWVFGPAWIILYILMGYNVFLASNGGKALELYRKNQDALAVVILDMIMPGISGGRTYDLLKEINPGVKVILSSGYSEDGEAARIMSRGCDGFIQKPFGIKELSQKIREVLDKN